MSKLLGCLKTFANHPCKYKMTLYLTMKWNRYRTGFVS